MKKNYKHILRALLMLFWAYFLIDSDSYYVPYLVLAIISALCFLNNYKVNFKDIRHKKLLIICSVIFSFMVVFANYSLWLTKSVSFSVGHTYILLYKLLLMLLLFLGGFLVAWNILFAAAIGLKDFSWELNEPNFHAPIKWFFAAFLLICFINTLVLFLCRYPGVLTEDTIWQVSQIFTGKYSNHHPFYHTMTVKLFISLGMRLFNNMNAAVATYSVFQILFMAFCFSMVLFTLSEIGISNKILTIVLLFYALMPYHIMYSFTIWKDVMFGGFVLLFILFLFRAFNKIGKSQLLNYIFMTVTGVGVCLFRSNGLFAFAAFFAVFCLLFFKQYKRTCLLLASIIIFSLVMKGPVLKGIGVTPADTVEGLSIPMQQIARVIVEKDDFKNDERLLLDQVIDTEAVKKKYKWWLSDNVKNLIQGKGNQQLLVEKKYEYMKLYFKVGFRHPVIYFKAWIDQTRGYWNGGYYYWRWSHYIFKNEYNIQRIEKSALAVKGLNAYLDLFSDGQLLVIFLCIGFHVWTTMFLAYMSIIRSDKKNFVFSVPILAIVLSLLISTPVSSEFRYIYAMFCVIPFLVIVTFYRKNGENANVVQMKVRKVSDYGQNCGVDSLLQRISNH